MVGFIYKYENKINHKVYIGQTTDLVSRKASHRYKSTFTKSKFYNAIRKYGWDNFDFDIIAQVEEDTLEKVTEVLDNLEVRFIEEYDSFNHGYNSTTGGHSYRGKVVSEEFKEYCRNRTYSEETRQKMSEAAHNRVVSEETKQKHRENALRRHFSDYRLLNEEKRIAALRWRRSKQVLQIDKDGKVIKVFNSLKEAASYIQSQYAPDRKVSGIEHGIERHCKNEIKKKLYYGFGWKFGAIV